MHPMFYGEVLPYLEIKKHETEDDVKELIEMPSVIGLTVSEATKILKDLGFEVNIENRGESDEGNDKIVTEQLPKKGIKVYSGSKVTIYT